MSSRKFVQLGIGIGFGLALLPGVWAHASMSPPLTAVQHEVAEWSYVSQETYADPFNEVEVDVIFTHEDGRQWNVPAFWAGGSEWRVRFAAPAPGTYKHRCELSVVAPRSSPGAGRTAGDQREGGNSLRRCYSRRNPRCVHTHHELTGNQSKDQPSRAGQKYRAFYFDPMKGEEHSFAVVTADASGEWLAPMTAAIHDWTLVLEKL